MKRTDRAPQVRPFIALAVLLLAFGVAVTTPIAMAKYTATATATTGSAKVALWDVKFTANPSGSTGYFSSSGTATPALVATNIPVSGQSNFPTQATTRTFTIKNDSEVMADISIKLFYVRSDNVDFVVNPATRAITSTDQANYPAIQDPLTDTGGTRLVNSGIFSISTTDVSLSPNDPGPGTAAGRMYRFPVGAQATFTITVKAPTANPVVPGTGSTSVSNWESCIRKYKVFFDAVQID